MKTCVLDIETEGLEPWNDRLVCIGVRDIDSHKTIVFLEEDERTMLERFILWYKRGGFREVIGFNVTFDLRFLFARCLKYELSAGELFHSTFTDIMDNLKSVKRMYSYNKPGKLNEWVQCVLGTSKLEKGDAVKEMYENREFTKIIQYCKQDVNLTYDLWVRIQKVLSC